MSQPHAINSADIYYEQLAEKHYSELLILANHVHGDNYLNLSQLKNYHNKGIKNDVNASWVALYQEKLIGFRLTYAPQQWTLDQWCTEEKWPVPRDTVCYFKCNTVDQSMRGLGIGSQLLKHSIGSVIQQGGKGGLAHIWAASPGNSAYKYFSKCGGKLITEHPDKWLINSIEDGFVCPICGDRCHCIALEMMVTFDV